MAYDKQAVERYRSFVKERHLIWCRRQVGEPGPWTTDPVMAHRKFTNMFRILDPGSQFVMTGLLCDDPRDFIARCVLYRLTNLPKTWYAMRRTFGRYPLAKDLNSDLADMLAAYRDAGNQVFSGAYVIIPEPGTANDKVQGAVRVSRLFVDTALPDFLKAETQQERFNILRSVPGIGNFLAMQILTDWGYGQKEEPDPTFIVAGPGAKRGAAILNRRATPEKVIHDMTAEWKRSSTVRLRGRPLTVMDVQNTMCELSKWHPIVAGEKPLRKNSLYKPAHPGPQPEPVLPAWW